MVTAREWQSTCVGFVNQSERWNNQTRLFRTNCASIIEVFYGIQYHSVVVCWYYRFFSIFCMCKMVIYSMYIIWKIFPPPSIHPITRILHIPFCISDTTRILPIPPMNITHTTKKWWYRINLNRQILKYRFFICSEHGLICH
jgi:hypothetical protein